MLWVERVNKEKNHGFQTIVSITAIILVAALLLGSLAACTLSASKGITDGGETTGDFPVPEDENMGLFDISATETAAAALVPQVVEPTPLLVFTATPEPAVAPVVVEVVAAPVQDLQPTAGNPPTSYTLQKGEFPFCIARRFDVNQSELLALNGLGLNSQVQPGRLKIPQTGNQLLPIVP
jgi:LysM repeat protein